MNTTKLAKWLIVLNTAMALAFLTWAVAIYTQSIDWMNSAEASASDRNVVRLDDMAKKIKTQADAHNKAYTLWLNYKAQVDEQERDRPARQDFYRGQIGMTKTGALGGQPVDLPFQEFVTNPNTGLMATDKATGRPPIPYKGNEPLRSISKYESLVKETTTSIQKVKEDIAKLIADMQTENDKIYDNNGNGLRKLIKEQEDILNAARLEREYLGTSYANAQAETTLFSKRLDALRARLAELNKVAGR